MSLCAFHWFRSSSVNTTTLRSFFVSAEAVMSMHLLFNGLGVIPPELCPAFKRDCGFNPF